MIENVSFCDVKQTGAYILLIIYYIYLQIVSVFSSLSNSPSRIGLFNQFLNLPIRCFR